ncbi:MAG: hypothetical protein IPO27_09215 [Bacteroidetes bacterium]|nr:hypothetical protein [Bacteroidota bacterium]
MARYFLLAFFFALIISLDTKAQTINQVDTSLNGKLAPNEYKFKLRRPAQCIDKGTLQKTGETLKSRLSDDGTEVIISNWRFGNSVYFEITYPDGQKDVYVKSPCALEMIMPL